ncbi:uncharacterized protein CLUP02_14959 [Colletotrichum lupini]|uniref:Uncharacterized protein n=1 Tax=Colletotrichum lupini TaxID=145971 RepID=A0A9Q8T566_9PEZI|nr:uncharacterized protein CLUP02_14959 [Colletotrichum lupini]UQC89428.1 hypothetical protein CLUP02_14959 [Colletotrichum lupini]
MPSTAGPIEICRLAKLANNGVWEYLLCQPHRAYCDKFDVKTSKSGLAACVSLQNDTYLGKRWHCRSQTWVSPSHWLCKRRGDLEDMRISFLEVPCSFLVLRYLIIYLC